MGSESLFETVAPQHNGVGVIGEVGADVIREAVRGLKTWKVPTIKPYAHKAHATCCSGWRKTGEHSPYCFSQREFYVAIAHPEAIAAIRNEALAGQR